MTQLAATQNTRNWDPGLARESVQAFVGRPGTLIEALHALQETFGYVDDEGIIMLASLYNLSRAEVHGVASFYHDFKRTPQGRVTIKVCQAEACQAMGSDELSAAIKKQLGIGFHETTADGQISLEPVYCLGNCACAPSIMIDKRVHARVTPERFAALAEAAVKEAK
jgi:formate dehydrogenase subunit gamma